MQRGFGYQNRRNAGFSPASLFLGGTVQGAWYDPSDSTTLFSDRAGTTPCGTPGGGSVVPVGRMLDKSGNGNHATAANDTTARPELRARVNLLTYSEDFSNAAWTKSGAIVTANAGVAPDGTTTADLLYPSATGSFRSAYQAFSGSNSITVSAKASGKNWISVSNTAGSNSAVWFDLANGTVGTVAAGYTATISAQGSGWYRCTLVANSGTFAYAQFIVVDADNTNTGTANGTDGVLLWGADGRPTNIGTAMPAYQRISDANTYDDVGFPRYLAFNGTSSAMSTPGNVDLSGTDKVTVFAGVRKLSDGAQGVVAELSATIASNNGTFLLAAPNSAAANYNFSSKGTTQVNNTVTTFTAPITNVLTGQADIAAPSNVIQVNGAPTTVTSTQGTGNFGTYPLFIGARNNASLFFNGNIYSLLVVGSAVSAGNISSTETWVAGKTGITL